MLIIYSLLLILCCSASYSWEVKSQIDELSSDGQIQTGKQTSEDNSDASPEAVRVEKIVKSSMLPYIVQEGSKSMLSKSISSSPSGSAGKVNTTIRLTFGKENSDQDSKVISETVKPNEFNFKQDMLNSKEHATRSHTEEMSSHKIIVYNQTKTEQQATKESSNNLLHQLQNMHWSEDEAAEGVKHFGVHEGIQVGSKDAIRSGQQNVISGSEASNAQKDVTRPSHDQSEERKLLEALEILLQSHDAPTVTQKPHAQSYNVSDDQVRLLHLLHKLIRNQDITYDFLNRLLLIFYMNGYRDELLKVLFEIIIEHVEKHGNSEEQQKLIQALIDLWKLLHKLQIENQGSTLTDHKSSSHEISREELRVLQLLQLISRLKQSNLSNQNFLRSEYLEELNGLYDSSRNKDHLIKVIHDFWKKNQALHNNTPDPTWKDKWHPSEDNSKKADQNGLFQHILKQKESANKKKKLINDYKNQHSDVLSRDEILKSLFDIINKNKVTKIKPDSYIIGQEIYEEVETENNPAPLAPDSGSKLWMFPKKQKPAIDTHVSEKERANKMYKALMELLTSTKITNKEELRIKVMEILTQIKSNKNDISNESELVEGNEGGSMDDSWGTIKEPKIKYESYSEECTTGASWTVNCQTCVCVRGLPVCKKLNDCFIRKPDEPMQCKPHTIFKLDICNRCKCNSDGIPICTFKQCKEAVAEVDDSSGDVSWDTHHALRSVICPPEKKWPVCAPNTNWRSGCHDCVCDADGQRNCQRVKNCQLLPFGQESNCQPNKIFVKGCKKCKCTEEGRLICIPVC